MTLTFAHVTETVFVFLCLTYITQWKALQAALCCRRRQASFFLQLSTLLYVYKICSTPSSLDGHLGGFRVLTTVNNAAGNGVGRGADL